MIKNGIFDVKKNQQIIQLNFKDNDDRNKDREKLMETEKQRRKKKKKKVPKDNIKERIKRGYIRKTRNEGRGRKYQKTI